MYMTNKPNGEPFYPVTVAEAVLVSEGENFSRGAATARTEDRRIGEVGSGAPGADKRVARTIEYTLWKHCGDL